MGGGVISRPLAPGLARRERAWKRPTLRIMDIEGTGSGTFLTSNHDEGPNYTPTSS